MSTIRSIENPTLTLDYLTNAPENKLFDRKSAKVKPSDLAPLISAFANADGGTIAIGIHDKSRIIEGINEFGESRINDFVVAPKNYCKPMPQYHEEFLDVQNYRGENDRLLLLHIDASPELIIRTQNDSVFLRIADKTKELKGDDLRALEYTKNTRHYEDELNYDAGLEDLDADLINQYKRIIGAENLSTAETLKARGFIRVKNGEQKLTNAAVLLFATNINQFYPNCRIRFIRYDGNYARPGQQINIIKDQSFDLPILRIITEARSFIASQLREFTALDEDTGKFTVVPEYPEFAWLEGIVNAVTHREYAMTGGYIRVLMFDDHLEIISPGRLPSIVTVDNIMDTRYSRNPRISRVLNDFGWVRELNEGVKRIYADMKMFFLDDPVYSEPEQASVKLVLKNNIVMRTMRQTARTMHNIGRQAWENLDKTDQLILLYLSNRKTAKRQDIESLIKKSTKTTNKRLKALIEKGLVSSDESPNDPNRSYHLSRAITS